jgi:hypothetical protein
MEHPPIPLNKERCAEVITFHLGGETTKKGSDEKIK